MESQSDQQERLRSSVQNFGSVFKGLIVALGLPLGGLLGLRLGLFGLGAGFTIFLLLVIFLLPVALLYTASYLSSREWPGDLETAAAVRIGLVILALNFLWGINKGHQLAQAL